MRTLLTAALLLTLFAPRIAEAAYVPDYSHWTLRDAGEKDAYISGSIDQFTLFDNPKGNSIIRCLINKEISSDMIRLQVDNTYASDIKRWNIPPIGVIYYVISDLCPGEIAIDANTILRNMEHTYRDKGHLIVPSPPSAGP